MTHRGRERIKYQSTIIACLSAQEGNKEGERMGETRAQVSTVAGMLEAWVGIGVHMPPRQAWLMGLAWGK